MKRERLQAATVGGTPDEVEQAFYEAINQGDIQQLMSCWAEEDDIVCIHPGGQRWVGSGAIRSAFQALFADGRAQVCTERVHKIDALASAVHHLVERMDPAAASTAQTQWRIVTNVYHKTPQGWRLVAHHASPGMDLDSADRLERAAVLH